MTLAQYSKRLRMVDVNTVASLTTPVLSPGQAFKSQLTIATYKAAQLLSVSSSAAARIEIYGTGVAQNADFSRGLDVPPGAGTAQNLVTDIALDTAPFVWTYQNRVATNGNNPQTSVLYVTVTNIGNGARAITVTLNYVPLES